MIAEFSSQLWVGQLLIGWGEPDEIGEKNVSEKGHSLFLMWLELKAELHLRDAEPALAQYLLQSGEFDATVKARAKAALQIWKDSGDKNYPEPVLESDVSKLRPGSTAALVYAVLCPKPEPDKNDEQSAGQRVN